MIRYACYAIFLALNTVAYSWKGFPGVIGFWLGVVATTVTAMGVALEMRRDGHGHTP